jgi:hypothetical protein
MYIIAIYGVIIIYMVPLIKKSIRYDHTFTINMTHPRLIQSIFKT